MDRSPPTETPVRSWKLRKLAPDPCFFITYFLVAVLVLAQAAFMVWLMS